MDFYEVLINELYFQGITLLNQLRRTFFIDTINPKIASIDKKDFTTVIVITDNQEEKDENSKEILDLMFEEFAKYKDYKDNKDLEKDQIILKELMIKIFLTVISKLYIYLIYKL
jgi:hypothetical protein